MKGRIKFFYGLTIAASCLCSRPGYAAADELDRVIDFLVASREAEATALVPSDTKKPVELKNAPLKEDQTFAEVVVLSDGLQRTPHKTKHPGAEKAKKQ